MTYISMLGAMAIGIAALAVGKPAAHAMPLAPANIDAAAPSDLVLARHRYRYRYVKYRRYYRGWRGYNSGGAWHGNIPGCAIDLGYGRWESCNR